MRTALLFMCVTTLVALAIAPAKAAAQACNIKVVTDANPDYHDIGGMIHSITDNWPDTKDKCWAMFYWNHIARRQTAPMILHGHELTDPIRQFNDYGYTMCSTVSGINCGIWGAMGLNVKFWDISLHTVPEVEYDGRYHMYDNSMSALYTLCDGKTIAGVTDIGADGACPASDNKTEPGHIARYHCLNATSSNGSLTGADCPRSVAEEYKCFNPKGLKYCYYHNGWDLGHRYVLNLRDGEVYTRYYHRLDADSKNAVAQSDKNAGYLADPAYFVPNSDKDPEAVNPRYHIRGNGLRTWSPCLAQAYQSSGVAGAGKDTIAPAAAGKEGWVIYRVQGANVITRLTIKAEFLRKTEADVNAVSISTTNGLTWKQVWINDKLGETPAEITLIDPVNGSYDVLVKVQLLGQADPADAQLKSIHFETITMLNGKTQPSLRLGKNTVYVGTGEPTESIVVWPDLRGDS